LPAWAAAQDIDLETAPVGIMPSTDLESPIPVGDD
jgi:hypothetical protein